MTDPQRLGGTNGRPRRGAGRRPGPGVTDLQLPGSTNGLGDIPLGGDGAPVFAAPWEASAFALAVRLSGEGYFTWGEWTAALSEEIHAAQREGDPDLGDTYYTHWLRALERLCRVRGLVSQEEASDRKDAWQRAYLYTPHGKPVELAPPQ